MDEELREQIAELQHELWSKWMRWQFSCCIQNDDGSMTIPAEDVTRWRRQMETPYADLTYPEQESARIEALTPLKAINEFFTPESGDRHE